MNVIGIEKDKMKLGVTTSVLFDMAEADACFRHYGAEGYRAYMKERIDEPLALNAGFEYAKNFSSRPNHEVALLSRNDPVTAIRAIKTMIQHGIVPMAFCFTNGADPTRYLKPYGIDSFMTANSRDAELAVTRGFAAVYVENPRLVNAESINFGKSNITPIPTAHQNQSNVVVLSNRVESKKQEEHHVFDFDGVIAGLSSDKVFQQKGLDLYRQFEQANLFNPLEQGPYLKWLKKLTRNHETYTTSIVTIRGGWALYRCLYDLARKDININGELHATAGEDKGPVLEILKSTYPLPTMYYDDRKKYVEQALRAGMLAGHVLHPEDPKA